MEWQPVQQLIGKHVETSVLAGTGPGTVTVGATSKANALSLPLTTSP